MYWIIGRMGVIKMKILIAEDDEIQIQIMDKLVS